MTEESAWLNALSLKQQVARLWFAFLVCSPQQIDCIYLLYEVAGEGINKRSSSQDALQNKYSQISQILKDESCESNFSKIAHLQTSILFSKEPLILVRYFLKISSLTEQLRGAASIIKCEHYQAIGLK